ncbi:AAA family ATPase [Micromonospora sp. WMMD718]|uniref:AAA family ATPase n=1 Tax=unclassified Micromonospora TaxID=2617518 RepID=UPI0009E239AB|nr:MULTISPECIES: AAA family ATPase [unclassified Micromonospora]MDG4755847.1 AAA family ATPase [Micromonospora sp. WMMD718]
MSGNERLRPGVCILGTSAGSGKTMIGRSLSRLASNRGYSVHPYKAVSLVARPVASHSDEIVDASLAMLAAAARVPATSRLPICSFTAQPSGDGRFRLAPAGPRNAGTQQSVDALAEDVHLDVYQQSSDQLRWDLIDDEDCDRICARIRFHIDLIRADEHFVVAEGSGNPTDSFGRDINNRLVFNVVSSPIILVTNLAEGGGIASAVGTLALLDDATRNRVCGVIVNGQYPGSSDEKVAAMSERATGQPCLAVVKQRPSNRAYEDLLAGEIENNTQKLAEDLAYLWAPLEAAIQPPVQPQPVGAGTSSMETRVSA